MQGGALQAFGGGERLEVLGAQLTQGFAYLVEAHGPTSLKLSARLGAPTGFQYDSELPDPDMEWSPPTDSVLVSLYESLDYLTAARIDLHCDDPPPRAVPACAAIAASLRKIRAAISELETKLRREDGSTGGEQP